MNGVTAESLVALYIYIYIYRYFYKKENKKYNKETNLEKLASIYSTKNTKKDRIKSTRIGLIEKVIKNKIRLLERNLSFLCVCEVMETKDKYV